ncbi:right-handed parallel beta-helix repeat-containing protein [Oleiharenicola lentus]|uniref:right-handed parallel beta-helix repeat-containing protein n=1 Tax=Oleiharenicola lentus TaxID=2508720 RepID=UPI003F66D691
MRSLYPQVFVACMLSVTAFAATTFHVAVEGSDHNDGGVKTPFATLARARGAVRDSPARGKEPITVIVGRGTYYLSEPLVFSPEDSGTAVASVSYVAAEENAVVLSGGEPLSLAWEKSPEGVWTAETPAGLKIDQLFLNDTPLRMARFPNYDASIAVYNGYSKDAWSEARIARWANPAGGFMHAIHKARWGGYHYRITGKDATGGLTYEGGWQNNRQMGMHPEFRYVEDIREELDAPGEWYHDEAARRLSLIPPAGVDVTTGKCVSVALRELVSFRGEAGAPVRAITLRGFKLKHVARTFMDTREPLLRSDWTFYRGGAVFLTGVEDCGLEDLTLESVGGNGIVVSGYARGVVIRGAHIVEPGASGVAFVGWSTAVRDPLFEYKERTNYSTVDLRPGPKTEDYPRDCVIEDSLIHGVGRVEKQAAGVEIAMASRITVRSCSIYDTSRAGINIGDGTWGGHVIEGCDVFDTVRETNDHGSFNSWGRDRFWDFDPAVINAEVARRPELPTLDAREKTVIRSSRWRCDHGWDIDLDDGSSNYEIYNNLCLRGGIKLREGYHRVVENNVLLNSGLHPHVWLEPPSDVFRHNIVMAPYKPARMKAAAWGRDLDHNWLHVAGATEESPAVALQEQGGRDAHSRAGDARFVDAAAGDFRVQDGSGARALGFKNFPMDQFGVRKPSLRKIARQPQIPAIVSHEPADNLAAGRFAWRGATVRPVSGLTDISALGLSAEAGAVLVEVPTKSEAAAAGLRAGDVVASVDGQLVKSATDLPRLAHGASHRLRVVRNQQDLEIIFTAR